MTDQPDSSRRPTGRLISFEEESEDVVASPARAAFLVYSNSADFVACCSNLSESVGRLEQLRGSEKVRLESPDSTESLERAMRAARGTPSLRDIFSAFGPQKKSTPAADQEVFRAEQTVLSNLRCFEEHVDHLKVLALRFLEEEQHSQPTQTRAVLGEEALQAAAIQEIARLPHVRGLELYLTGPLLK